MKNIFLATAIVCSITASAQKPVFTQAHIESARVYSNAAELTHKATANVPAGTSEIVITNVANYLNENTLQLKVPQHVTVMSLQYTNAYIEEYDNNQDSPLIKPIKEEIDQKTKALKKLRNQIETEQHAIELLDENQEIKESQNFTVAELAKLLEFYKTNRNALSNKVDEMKEQEQTLLTELQTLKGKLSFNNTSTEKVSQGKIIAYVTSQRAGSIPIEVNYLSQSAGWQPSYEMRIDKINQPIQMMYKAQVVQNTGFDWKNVKLSLTSGQANQNTVAPELHPWFVDYQIIRNKSYVSDGDLISTGEMSGNAPKDSAQRTIQEDFNEETTSGKLAVGQSTMSDYTQINESQLNITFDIDIPYTILSNSKKHSVSLKEVNVPATYTYLTIPKLDNNVYLVAKVSDYSQYNMLPGQANVVFDGMYVGKTYINPSSHKDELQLSLGKDPNISVDRKVVSDQSGTKMLSSKKEQNFTYEITVRNNKKENVALLIEDHIPVSKNKDIEVSLTDKKGADFDEETGKLSWTIKLKPNSSEKIRFGYMVKSDKNQQLYL